jgi:biopolymer transport protein ExbB/TolQ
VVIYALYTAIGLTAAVPAVFLALILELVMTRSAQATRADRVARELTTVRAGS